VGTICGYKNQNALIRALDPIAQRLRLELVFLGANSTEDPYGREFLQLVRERPWCRHEGFASRKSLKSALARASALILPSLEDNCPMVILEAMAAGVPVAASEIGGIPDLVIRDETGLLFDPSNSTDMQQSVRRLVEQRGFARECASRAKNRAMKLFHPREVARRHLEVYQSVLRRAS
jgi:glycosyltransferase involved in cell wall biosynthesis